MRARECKIPGGICRALGFHPTELSSNKPFNPMKTGPSLRREPLVELHLSCCAFSSGFGREERFDFGDGVGDAVGREGLEEDLAVALAGDAGIEEDEGATVFKGADEAAEALLESEDCFGDLVVEEGTATGLFDGAHAGLHDGVGGNSEGETINDDATEGFALNIDSLPEAGGTEEDGVGGGAEFFKESLARGGAVEQEREIEDGEKALVEGAHLGVAGEKAEGAAAGDAEDTLDGRGCGGNEVRVARVRHGGREIKESLPVVTEVGGDDELAGVGEAETTADVVEAALNGERGGSEDDGGDLFEDEGAKELGNVDGGGLEKCTADAATGTTASSLCLLCFG